MAETGEGPIEEDSRTGYGFGGKYRNFITGCKPPEPYAPGADPDITPPYVETDGAD